MLKFLKAVDRGIYYDGYSTKELIKEAESQGYIFTEYDGDLNYLYYELTGKGRDFINNEMNWGYS